MKKLAGFLLSGVLAAGCAFAFVACRETPLQDQPNNMSIKRVSQSAHGGINITVDVKDVAFSDKDGELGYDYSIQLSSDGGANWYDRTVYLEKDKIKNNEYTFTAFGCMEVLDENYDVTGHAFYVSNSQDEVDKTSLAFGDSVSLALRFAENYHFKVSESTEPFSYTVKDLAPAFVFSDVSTEEGFLPDSEDFAFDKQGRTFKIIQKGSDDSVLAGFEYKFTTLDADVGNAGEENNFDLTGWLPYYHSRGITENDGLVYKTNEYVQEIDGETLEVIANKKRKVIPVLVRQKATDTACKSPVVLVRLVLTDWEVIDN